MRGRAPAPALLLVLAGALVVVLAWVWGGGGDGASPAAQTEETGASAAPDATPQPGATIRAEDLAQQRSDWQPGTVLPPDSTYRRGVPPVHALVRGRVVALSWVSWPRRAVITLSRQEDDARIAERVVNQEEPDFRFEELPFGDYRLRLEADEFEPMSVLVTARAEAPDQFLNLQLTPAASVSGLVRGPQGQPIAGIAVCVEWRPTAPGDLVVPLEARTDAEGRFRIPGLRQGEYDVYAGPARAAVGPRVAVFVGPGAPQAWADLQVPELGAARVTLEDLDRAGLAGVKVLAQMTRPAGAVASYRETREPGSDGVARFDWLPPGEYGFTVQGGAFRRTVREGVVAVGSATEVRIPLRPAARGADAARDGAAPK